MTPQVGLIYFPAALLLGGLHALEPGHAKVLTASYLIGIKGTKRDALTLGLSVALTHSLVVILISVIGLWLGNEAFTGRATEWLERGSGLVAIVIGAWMLWRRLYKRFHVLPHDDYSHPAAAPVQIRSDDWSGTIEIIPTPLGERVRLTQIAEPVSSEFRVRIERENGRIEELALTRSPENDRVYLSSAAPEEPHEFRAAVVFNRGGKEESARFEMHEPEGHHHHDHEHMDDVAHAKAHAEDLPDYAKRGVRPTTGQIIAFGAAGGMIPCPASITVMLLALAAGKTAMGLFTVMGFSLGLAITLVGVGMIVVTGLSRIENSGRFAWITKNAPVISACLVIFSGVFALLIAHGA